MWRNTGIVPKLFIFDVRSFLFFLPFFIHISQLTFYIGVTALVFFWILRIYKISVINAVRYLFHIPVRGIRPVSNKSRYYFKNRIFYNREFIK